MPVGTIRVEDAKKAAQAAAAWVARATRTGDAAEIRAARQELAYRKARRMVLEQLDGPGLTTVRRRELVELVKAG